MHVIWQCEFLKLFTTRSFLATGLWGKWKYD